MVTSPPRHEDRPGRAPPRRQRRGRDGCLRALLGVVSPASSSIIGGTFMIVRLANNTAVVYDSLETAPLATSKGLHTISARLIKQSVRPQLLPLHEHEDLGASCDKWLHTTGGDLASNQLSAGPACGGGSECDDGVGASAVGGLLGVPRCIVLDLG